MSLTLTLSDHLHEMIRQSSIRTVYDALVELITNADDAYRTINQDKRVITLKVNPKENKLTDVTVSDKARGMTNGEMLTNLLTVGGNTASEKSRGMMGRGAKDCSFLGNITFTCIKDGLLNQLIIYQNRKADFLQKDVPVTPEVREQYQIEQNGCSVNLEMKSELVPDTKILGRDLTDNIYLRNILTDPNITLTLNGERLQYVFGDRKLVISCDYNLPEYNTSAHLEIYRTSEEIPSPKTPDQCRYGILVSSDKTVHECSALYHVTPGVQDHMWNPNIRYVTGSLTCKDIDKVARDAVNGNLSAANPFLVVDTNRRAGLVKDHPFTKALYSHAYHLLNVTINRLQDTRDTLGTDAGNAASVFNSLNSLISGMLPTENVLYTWRTKQDQNSLAQVVNVLDNVNADSNFLGLTWDQIQNLTNNKYLTLDVEATGATGNFINISFTTDPNVRTHYQVIYLPGKIDIKINANDPSIKPFVGITGSTVNLVNSGKALTAIGAFVIEATNNMMVRRAVMTGKTSALDINSLNEYIWQANDARVNVTLILPLVL